MEFPEPDYGKILGRDGDGILADTPATNGLVPPSFQDTGKNLGVEGKSGAGVILVSESKDDNVLKRKQRRTTWETSRKERKRFELHRNLGNMLRRAEDLLEETNALKKRLRVQLPEEDSLPEAETQRLAQAHKKRLSYILSSVCKKILQGIMANKWSWPFNAPVDTRMYPDYLDKVQKPMDFGAVKKKIDTGVYTHPEQFVEDVRLVFNNARTYNKPGSDVHVMASTLQEKFEDRCAASITPRVIEETKTTDAENIAARKKMADDKALKLREGADGECAALLQAIDSLVSDIDIEKIKAVSQCDPVERSSKEELCKTLQQLPEKHFAKVVSIVMNHYPGLKQANNGISFDLETLDALCLRQIMDYVATAERAIVAANEETICWPPRTLTRSTKNV